MCWLHVVSSACTCTCQCFGTPEAVCLTARSWSHFSSIVNRFRDRAKVQHSMAMFLMTAVWPDVPSARVHTLRGVLYAHPRKIRTPEDVLKHGAAVGDAVLQTVECELVRKGLVPLSDAERAKWLAFVSTHCVHSRSGLDSSSAATSGSYQPANKMRVLS